MKDILDQIRDQWKLWLIASLTLGLAPFTPPHLWGKLVWVAGDSASMKAKDWFDLLMHGSPWVLLIIAGVLWLIKKK